jgi:DNA-binding ferritin-like protein
MLRNNKKKVETPESKIQSANIHVEAQQAQFVKMKQEVEYAVGQRFEAIEELNKEVASLQAQLSNKLALIEKAKDQNTADMALVDRVKQFIG